MSLLSYVASIRDKYIEWVNQDRYLILNSYNSRTYKSKYYAVLCSKRGNIVYRKRVMNRFAYLSRKLSGVVFFDSTSNQHQYTSALWVTLTYNPSLSTLDEAWQQIGIEFNRFRSKMTQKYGKMSLLRCFEAFKDPQGTAYGYPHIHALIVFHNYKFSCQKRYSFKRGYHIWRINDEEKEQISKYWHSFVDIEACSSLNNPLRYLRKYITKSITVDIKNQHVLNTLALTWYFHKRSFSVSNDLIRLLHNSNPIKKIYAQTDLLGNILDEVTITVIGVVSAEVLNLRKTVAYTVLDDAQIKSVECELGNLNGQTLNSCRCK